MCVVSMVFDHYEKRIPQPWKFPQPLEWVPNPGALQWSGKREEPTLKAEIAELRQLINEFREAVAAAKRVDELTDQPDCHDPEKAKLEQRVADLERRLDQLGV